MTSDVENDTGVNFFSFLQCLLSLSLFLSNSPESDNCLDKPLLKLMCENPKPLAASRALGEESCCAWHPSSQSRLCSLKEQAGLGHKQVWRFCS